jgi:hypothetical protein
MKIQRAGGVTAVASAALKCSGSERSGTRRGERPSLAAIQLTSTFPLTCTNRANSNSSHLTAIAFLPSLIPGPSLLLPLDDDDQL